MLASISLIFSRITNQSLSREASEGWIDLTKLVTGGGSNKGPYDELASEIGKQVYIDIAGWHLYMRDLSANPTTKMHQALALQIGPKASQGRISESDISDVLKKIPIKAGAGKTQVTLYDLTPSMCLGDLARIAEDFQRR
ncbi:hypothetical protein CEUSTIGMA_g3416.t1 [Chlamydomonas eustigma]|uniref:Uncharacterized protein n=1 Tax=Chlamydomonas eustigma TaxID=1157962 RepID=A0A250WYQ2_9CHLO|nr:hypothetical protein CEUSTIGMA_g3416.t1 [Chlamydomonas eustigma]|eukprot:GAX75973.1 hypothetical protein CEUSTIGMA_g3416.t1 [Chlamydomonas eustigma]